MPFLTLKKYAWAVFILFFFTLGSLSLVEAGQKHSQSAESLYSAAKKDYYQLKNSKKLRAYRQNWVEVVDSFTDVYEKYPSSQQAYNALFTAARLYHQLYKVTQKTEDLDQAAHYYYKVISEFKDGSLTDDALFYRGEIFLEKKNREAARSVFERIVQRYPQGDQAEKARKWIGSMAPLTDARNAVPDKNIAGAVSSPTVLNKISYQRQPNSTRIVVYTGGPAKISQNRLSDPDRIYFNFFDTQLDDRLDRDVQINGDVLTRLRVSQFDKTTSRLVLDIPADKEINIVTSQEDSRFVIDLFKKGKAIATVPSVQAKAPETLSAVPVAISPKPQKKARNDVPVIVVDPGHGGKDFGAKSPKDLYEKDINLEIAKRLAKILETRYGYKVIMTREDDTFISLKRRGEIANENNADLFVSVHVNAAKRHSAHGIETYYLGTANSEQAQETAARENGELVQSVKDDQVQQILASLISTTKINDSALLAGHVQESLHSSLEKKYSGVRDLGVKEGPFFVLHDTNMPSILVEVGFITNSREERRLRQPDYWNQLASSIAQGVHEFKKDKGPTI